MSKLIIYGAKALALGACRAIQSLYPEHQVEGFVVKSLNNNPKTLAGLSVWELSEIKEKNIHILIATPEDVHEEIIYDLKKYGFFQYTCMDSKLEASLMERYFEKLGLFSSIHSLPIGHKKKSISIYMAKSTKDKPLKKEVVLPQWISPLWAGPIFDEKIQTGENISKKNGNYCELTALYWIWKNKLHDADYLGLCHYRRFLDLTNEDIWRIGENDVDAVLPWPTLHEPDILEHHTRYMEDSDWDAMQHALKELQPEYAETFPEILSRPYLYNYNIFIAKKEVFANYCQWLFPVLERTEELSVPKGSERSDRYIGYLGENLLTLYFMYHRRDLNIVHTGRKMLI